MLELISPKDELIEPAPEWILSPEEAESVKKRYLEEHSTDWDYIFAEITNEEWKNKMVELFKALDEETDEA